MARSGHLDAHLGTFLQDLNSAISPSDNIGPLEASRDGVEWIRNDRFWSIKRRRQCLLGNLVDRAVSRGNARMATSNHLFFLHQETGAPPMDGYA